MEEQPVFWTFLTSLLILTMDETLFHLFHGTLNDFLCFFSTVCLRNRRMKDSNLKVNHFREFWLDELKFSILSISVNRLGKASE